MVNCERELRMRADIRRKKKVEKAIEFVEKKSSRESWDSIEVSLGGDKVISK